MAYQNMTDRQLSYSLAYYAYLRLLMLPADIVGRIVLYASPRGIVRAIPQRKWSRFAACPMVKLRPLNWCAYEGSPQLLRRVLYC